MAFRMQLASKFVFICLMFGSSLPVIYLFAALFFRTALTIDRINFFRRMSSPPRTTARLVRTVHNTVFPLGLAAHSVMAVSTGVPTRLAHLCERDPSPHPPCEHPPRSPPPPPTLPTDRPCLVCPPLAVARRSSSTNSPQMTNEASATFLSGGRLTHRPQCLA